MKHGGVEAAITALTELSKGSLFSSEVIRKHSANIPPAERKLAYLLFYLALNRYPFWEKVVAVFLRKKSVLPMLVRSSLIIGIAGITELKNFHLPVFVNAVVECVKRKTPTYTALVNACLRRYLKERKNLIKSLKEKDFISYLGFNEFLYKRLKDFLKEDFNDFLNLKPMSALRITSLKFKEYLLDELKDKGITFKKGVFKKGLRCDCIVFPLDFKGYKSGYFSVMSESSQLIVEVVALLLAVDNGSQKTFVDLCCGRGVKSAQIYASLNTGINMFCVDVSLNRLKSAKKEFKRIKKVALSKGKQVSFICADASKVRLPLADVIMVDAPCSGSGTILRHPELKFKIKGPFVKSAASIQKSILKNALNILSPEGLIIYSVCSILKEETEDVIRSVIEHSDFELSVDTFTPEYKSFFNGFNFVDGEYGRYILPLNSWVDGFYIAVLKRRK